MTDTTLPGLLRKGVAASRPAANAVGGGTIYSATDTGAITQSDGVSTWSTYATITGSGAPTTADYLVGTADGGLSAEIVVGTLAASYTAWTPTLTAASVNPTLGSGGTAVGRYTQIGKHVSGYGTITFGSSGVAAGTGEYHIALPATATATTPRTMGSVVLYDSSTGTFNLGVVYYSSTTVARIAITGTALVVSEATPWVWAANDAIVFNLDYEAA